MQELNMVQVIAVWALPVLFAITIHEVAHGWVAKKLGDPTAMMMGRLTLNPLKHIDPIGTVVVPLALKLMGGIIFGWAKPVPVTWANLRNPKRDMALVALAGPMSNLMMAIGWALIIRVVVVVAPALDPTVMFLLYVGIAGIYINIILMVLNLLPLPPLDGGRVLVGLLPGPLSWKVSRIEPYGAPILIALLVLGVLGKVLSPIIFFFIALFSVITGLAPDMFLNLLTVIM